MSYSFGLTIESLVAILLLLTIIYCARLNSRLERLRANEGAMKTSVSELLTATEAAERAIAGLKATVRECKETLDPRLRDADALSTALTDNLKAGEAVLANLRKIAAVRGSLGGGMDDALAAPKPAPTDTRSMVAAAQAFAERTRTRSRSGFAA
jgi:hypothetical protein